MHSKLPIEVAKNAAKTVVNTLNKNDWTTIVTFEERVCVFSDFLEPATDVNKYALSAYIDTITTREENEFRKAF